MPPIPRIACPFFIPRTRIGTSIRIWARIRKTDSALIHAPAPYPWPNCLMPSRPRFIGQVEVFFVKDGDSVLVICRAIFDTSSELVGVATQTLTELARSPTAAASSAFGIEVETLSAPEVEVFLLPMAPPPPPPPSPSPQPPFGSPPSSGDADDHNYDYHHSQHSQNDDDDGDGGDDDGGGGDDDGGGGDDDGGGGGDDD